MSTRSVHVPAVLDVGRGAIGRLDATLRSVFAIDRAIVATGGPQSRVHAESVRDVLTSAGTPVTVIGEVSGTIAAAEALTAELAGSTEGAIDGDRMTSLVVLGVGGGRPLDAAKLAANRAGVPFVSVPTVLSHDGVCSPVASLAGDDGVRQSLASGMPSGVVIDLDVVSQAPEPFTRAGIGDLVSNLTAVADWRRAAEAGEDVVDELAASLALQSALPIFDIRWPLDEVGWQLVARGLVMSGLAMEMAGSSRPCSGAEHQISHALDRLLGASARPHGIQVALGVLLVAEVLDVPVGRIRELYARIGFPTRPDAWGIAPDVLARAIVEAPGTRPNRWTVLRSIDRSEEAAAAMVRRAFEGFDPAPAVST